MVHTLNSHDCWLNVEILKKGRFPDERERIHQTTFRNFTSFQIEYAAPAHTVNASCVPHMWSVIHHIYAAGNSVLHPHCVLPHISAHTVNASCVPHICEVWYITYMQLATVYYIHSVLHPHCRQCITSTLCVTTHMCMRMWSHDCLLKMEIPTFRNS